MNYYQVKFIKNGETQDKEYTYGFDGALAVGDKVDLPFGHGVICADVTEDIMAFPHFDASKIKSIVKKTEDKEDEKGEE